MPFRAALIIAAVLPALGTGQQPMKPRPYRLPAADLKQRIIWDAKCEDGKGGGLAFGGQDQQANTVRSITRVLKDGTWENVLGEPKLHAMLGEDVVRLRRARDKMAAALLKWRREFLTDRGLKSGADEKVVAEFRTTVSAALHNAVAHSERYRTLWQTAVTPSLRGALIQRVDRDPVGGALLLALSCIRTGTLLHHLRPELDYLGRFALPFAKDLEEADRQEMSAVPSLEELAKSARCFQRIDMLLDALEIVPPPRALAAIAYDPRTDLYVMFGGDHLDYLMNDTWVFDMKTKRWSQRVPKSAPPARANHKLIANGDGTITLKGGYTYSNNTDYMGGPYIDIADGDWTYDIVRNEWKGEGKTVSPCTRVYRGGPFHPSYFLQDPKPDAKAFAKWLDELPVNEWKKTNPPHLPQMNRDWGTAVLDTRNDMILRWAGGHSAHGGTDVLHFHLSTNRWELPFPVELPLGQTYANTEYPDGFNFNRRPWITGHTYQNYAYDRHSGQLVFTGRPRHIYYYDPAKGDWTGTRDLKPKGMSYDSCFYTLTLTPTPHGLVCWTAEGKLFYNELETLRWVEVRTGGEKLPGAVVDNSTLAYDTKRDRLLFFRKGYGDKTAYDGEVYELDWKSLLVRKLAPEGMAAAAAIPYLCQIRYDPGNDLMLVGATLPPDAAKLRRTPAYDCAKNRWVELKITGDDPSGKNGRNVSLGLVYDPKRELWWAVDAKSQLYVMRLDAAKADVQPLKR